MRFAASLLALSFVVAGCSNDISGSCPSGTTTGTAPHCVITGECIASHTGVKLDCSGSDGTCICSENGVEGKTVDYQDAFCNGASDSQTVDPDALNAANSACGWSL